MEEAALIFVQLYDLWKPVGRSPAVTNLKNGGNSCGHVDQQNTDSTVNDLNNWLNSNNNSSNSLPCRTIISDDPDEGERVIRRK